MFEKFIHQTPFFRFALALIFGIVFRITFPDIDLPYLIIGISLFSIILIFNFSKQSKVYIQNQIWGFLVSVFIFITGILLVQLKQNCQYNFQNKEYTFVAHIIEKPEEKENSIKTILQMESYKDSIQWISNTSRLLCYFEKDSLSKKIQIGDQILIKTYINEITHSGNPYAFNYKNYLKYQEIYSQVYLSKESYQLVDQNKGSWLLLFTHKLRQKLLHIYKAHNISGNEFAVLSALTLGYKTELTPDLKESYSASGAMHVLAVSGLHVGIIFIILSKILFFTNRYKKGKYIRATLTILILFLYAGITGFSNSVVRATIMFSFISIGNMFTRQVSIYNSLSAAAFCMLIYNPYNIMNVGFQLSFLAVISIVFFQVKIYSLFQHNTKLVDYIWQLVSVAIAAQVLTFPLTIYYFNQFPLYFILSNILIIPMVSVIIYSAILLFMFSFSGYLSSVISKFLDFITHLLNLSVEFIEQLPYAKLDDIVLDKIHVIILFFILTFILFYILKKQYQYLKLSLILFISLFIYNISNNFYKSQKACFVVHHVSKSIAIDFIDERHSYLLTNLTDSSKNFKYNILPLWQGLKINTTQIDSIQVNKFLNYFQFNDLRIAHVFNDSITRYQSNYKIKTDYLILSNNISINISDLIKYFDFKQIIFDSSNSYYKTADWIDQCNELGINYYNVQKEGAYINYL